MYTIQANPSGTRNLEISEENLATIENTVSSVISSTVTASWTKPYSTNSN